MEQLFIVNIFWKRKNTEYTDMNKIYGESLNNGRAA